MAGMTKEILIKPELRPCWANGKEALFHKWITEEKAFLIPKHLARHDVRVAMQKDFSETLVVPNDCEVKVIIQNFALVEFEVGIIEKIAPEDVVFCDSEALFYGYQYYWTTEDTE